MASTLLSLVHYQLVRQILSHNRVFWGGDRALPIMACDALSACSQSISSIHIEDIGWSLAKVSSDIGPLDQQVMLAIMRQHPRAYGVSIQELIEERTGREYSVGAIYASLDRLEERGYVAAKKGEVTEERGGRAKLYFNLTAPGQAALQQSLRALDSLRRGVRWTEALV